MVRETEGFCLIAASMSYDDGSFALSAGANEQLLWLARLSSPAI